MNEDSVQLDASFINPKVLIKTTLGDIIIEVYEAKASITSRNFFRHIYRGLYNGTNFFRTVTMDNQPDNEVKIEVVQGGMVTKEKSLPAIEHEPTYKTGLKHIDGAVSMARGSPGTASSSFFICIGDQLELDYGGMRNPDEQGFAVFGQVVGGMDLVRHIHMQPCEGQRLTPPIEIVKIQRKK